MGRVSLAPKRTVLRQQKCPKRRELKSVIAVSIEYTSKLQHQDVSIRHFLDSFGNTGCVRNQLHVHRPCSGTSYLHKATIIRVIVFPHM